MRPNTSGLPSTESYNLGRGIVYFAEIDDTTGLPKAYRDLGNAPEFSITQEVETLPHQSSRGGLRVTDKEVTISQTASISLTLDEINFENLASFLSGNTSGTSDSDTAGHLNPTYAGVTERALIDPGEVVLGRWYDLVSSNGSRCYDLDKTQLTVKDEGATTYSEGTDYLVDEQFGRIFLLETGSVADGGSDGVDFTLAADSSADQYIPEVKALTQTSITGALKFISINPANNDSKAEIQFHKISLKAEGDFNLIGEEYSQMTFTGVAERNELADPDSPTCTIRTVMTPQAA
jgi:hypothetical protein